MSPNVASRARSFGMQEGQLLMTQTERDRLVTLKKAKKKVITQREAAEEPHTLHSRLTFDLRAIGSPVAVASDRA